MPDRALIVEFSVSGHTFNNPAWAIDSAREGPSPPCRFSVFANVGTSYTAMWAKIAHDCMVCRASSLRNCCLICCHCRPLLPRPMQPVLVVVQMCATAAAASHAADVNLADDGAVATTAAALAIHNTNGPLLLLMLLLYCCCCSCCHRHCHCRFCC
jgi:hypothetical protein